MSSDEEDDGRGNWEENDNIEALNPKEGNLSIKLLKMFRERIYFVL
jgi:hypothetical protein